MSSPMIMFCSKGFIEKVAKMKALYKEVIVDEDLQLFCMEAC